MSVNQATDQLLTFVFGWSTAPAPHLVDFAQAGMSLAVRDQSTIQGFQAMVVQQHGFPQMKFVYELTFKRVSTAPSTIESKDSDSDEGPLRATRLFQRRRD